MTKLSSCSPGQPLTHSLPASASLDAGVKGICIATSRFIMFFEAEMFLFLLGMVVHRFNPKIWEGEAGGALISWPAWSTLPVSGYPETHRENLPQKQNKTFLFTTKPGSPGILCFRASVSLLTPPPPKFWDYRYMCHHAQLFQCFGKFDLDEVLLICFSLRLMLPRYIRILCQTQS